MKEDNAIIDREFLRLLDIYIRLISEVYNDLLFRKIQVKQKSGTQEQQEQVEEREAYLMAILKRFADHVLKNAAASHGERMKALQRKYTKKAELTELAAQRMEALEHMDTSSMDPLIRAWAAYFCLGDLDSGLAYANPMLSKTIQARREFVKNHKDEILFEENLNDNKTDKQ